MSENKLSYEAKVIIVVILAITGAFLPIAMILMFYWRIVPGSVLIVIGVAALLIIGFVLVNLVSVSNSSTTVTESFEQAAEEREAEPR